MSCPKKERIKHGLPEGATYGDALAIVMFKAALEGKTDGAREIREGIEGKTGPRQENFHTQPAHFVVSYATPVPGLAPSDASVSDASASGRSIA